MDETSSLQDHLAIVDLTYRYCWSLDTREWSGLDSVFTPDAHAELLSPLLVGREAIRTRIAAAIEPLDATQHTITNHMIEIDGDHASCRSYVHAQHVRHSVEGGPTYVVAGRYEDQLIRTPDGWRITNRRLVVTWTDGNLDVVRRRVPTADDGGGAARQPGA